MICVALQEKDVDACLRILKTIEMAEIRIDLAQLNVKEVERIFTASTVPLIATCRPGYYSDSERMTLLKTAIEHGAAYVDIEIESSVPFKAEMLAFARKHATKLIISYHNFDETPSLETLKSIVKECFETGADIAKLATMVISVQDNARLMSLYDSNQNLVVLGMGNIGKITRIMAPSLGAPFTFASLDKTNATAPGQISYQSLKNIQEQITEL